MARKIKISVGSATAIALLHDNEAPQTCQQIWEQLPLTGLLQHGNVDGPAVFLPLPKDLRLQPENQTVYPIEGDLMYYYKPINYVQLDIPIAKRELEVIGLVRGRDAQIMGPIFPLPVNLFGQLIEGKEELYSEINRMREEGFDNITISKYED
jgi:hypothetical protein